MIAPISPSPFHNSDRRKPMLKEERMEVEGLEKRGGKQKPSLEFSKNQSKRGVAGTTTSILLLANAAIFWHSMEIHYKKLPLTE